MAFKRPTKETRPESLLLRISVREKEAIKQAAQEQKTTVSNFMRESAVDKIMVRLRARFDEYEKQQIK